MAEVVLVEGKVEYLRPRTEWRVATNGLKLLVNDSLYAHERSSATLRHLEYGTLKVRERTTFTLGPPKKAGTRGTVDVIRGAIYLFFRGQPREVLIQMPHGVGAGLGTDLMVTVEEDRSTVVVFDGEVELSNGWEPVRVPERHVGIIERGQKPRVQPLEAVNIVQWWLYYPGIVAPDELPLTGEEKKTLEESIRAYRDGDLTAALQSYPAERPPRSESERLYFAGLLLAAGQVAQAEAELAELGEVRFATAMREMMAAVQHRRFQGNPTPASAMEWMARSYYQQSTNGLAEARQSAREAVKKSPEFGFAWARVAELEFSFGERARMAAALEKALAFSPRNAQALALRGFVLAAENRFRAARQAFDEAIEVDGNLANAWLGRGLVRIRLGDAEGGRHDLQTAAGLEPNRSLLRSYLGKAYAYANRQEFANKELAFARELDPNDPTPWLYSALLRNDQNRLNEAVGDLEWSQDLNENRAVYRSRLLLDQDRGVRSANLASIYRDAGMFDWSAQEASRAVMSDYANYSAHLFLANSYNSLRDPYLVGLRYETATFSEYLMANLLSPAGGTALSPTVSQQEYSRLFQRDRLGVASSTTYRSNGDWEQEGSQYGLYRNTGYALDGAYRSISLDRPNSDLEQMVLSAQIKQQITPSDSIYLQGIYSELSSGDVRQLYDPADSNPSLRITERQDPNLFFGFHHEWQPGLHTLFLGGMLRDDFRLSANEVPINTLVRNPNGPPFVLPRDCMRLFGQPCPGFTSHYESQFEAFTTELQQIWQTDCQTLVIGGRVQTGTADTKSLLEYPSAAAGNVYAIDSPAASQQSRTDLHRISAYGYEHWHIGEPLWLLAGVAYDELQYPDNIDLAPISDRESTKRRFSPKAGILWAPTAATIVRGAYTRSMGGLFYDASVRLEPTQIAGFNQAYRSLIPESVEGAIAGSEFETFGLGFEQKFRTRTYVTLQGELLRSDAERERGLFFWENDPTTSAVPSSVREEVDYQERSLTLALNQLLAQEWAFGVRYRLSEAELDSEFSDWSDSILPDADNRAVLNHLDLVANYNHPWGILAQAQALWRKQSNSGYRSLRPGDDFWQFNFFVGYRLPQRRAELVVGLLNLTDQDYRLNPLNFYSELPRERTLSVNFRFYF